ncbi:MAG TPA: kelch repeat-containing protein [Candidatus Kapabacteria bacterium]
MKLLSKNLVIALLLLLSAGARAQIWQFTGSLSEPKRTGVLVTLPNQTAIYVGGADASGFPLAACELYDPATAVWTLAAPMQVGRERHTVTQLADGRLVSIGGNTSMDYDMSQPTGSIEIYDFASNTWLNGGSLALARQNHTATLLNDGTILITGGYDGSNVLTSCEIYDPSTQTCHTVAPMLLARHDHSATLLPDGRVLVVGGRDGGSGSDYFSESEIYDPVSNTWNATGSMNQSRIKGSLVTFSDGTVLASGGRNSPSTCAPGSEILFGDYSTWASTSAMMEPATWNGSSLLAGDRFLVTGGLIDDVTGTSFTGDMTPTCEWYDKPNQRWFFAPQLNIQRSYHGQCLLHQTVNSSLPEDMILVAGGITGDYSFTQTSEVLDVTDHALLTYEAMPQNFAAVTAPNAPNSIASIKISSSNQPMLQLQLEGPATVSWEIMSSTGRTITPNQTANFSMGSFSIPLNSNQSSGIYFVRVTVGSTITTLKYGILQ